MAFLSYNEIAGDSCTIVKNASLFHFGVLTSSMHMVWVNQVCGRLEGRYRYSNMLVYNNFPWPKSPISRHVVDVENKVQELLNIRKEYDDSLADLYNPLLTPKKLTDAHKKLNRAVELCYRSKKFNSDLERLQYLFELYDDYVTE